MAQGVTYVTVQQFCAFHQCDHIVVEEFLDHGIFTVEYQGEITVIPEPEVPRVEKALRLYRDLGVNAAGIDIILRLLDRLDGERHSVVEDW